MTFGQKLSSLRKLANLTQIDLANKIGVSRQAVTKWEKGVGLPDIDNIKKIASIFNTSIDKLLDYKIETIELQLNSIAETIDKQNSKWTNVDNFILEKFKDSTSIHRICVEPNYGFWKSLFYTVFDIDIALVIHDLISKGLNHCYLIEKATVQYIATVNKNTLITKKLSQHFNNKKLILDGYKYTKLKNGKLK